MSGPLCIALRHQMGGRARRHALADRPAVYDHHVLSGPAEFIGDRQAGIGKTNNPMLLMTRAPITPAETFGNVMSRNASSGLDA